MFARASGVRISSPPQLIVLSFSPSPVIIFSMLERRYDIMPSIEVPPDIDTVGLVGHPQSGKSTVVEILRQEFRFAGTSFRPSIENEAWLDGVLLKTRTQWWERSLKLQHERGEDFLMTDAMGRLHGMYKSFPQGIKGFVIDGFRVVSNAQRLQAMDNAYLIGITAKREIRRSRVRKDRPEDHSPEDERNASEAAEAPFVDEILGMADIIIPNEGDIEEFRRNVIQAVRTRFSL